MTRSSANPTPTKSTLLPASPVRVDYPHAAGGRAVDLPDAWLNATMGILKEPTSPFHEQNVICHITRFAGSLGLDVRSDRAGNLIVDYRPASVGDGSPAAAPLVLSAHMDHPGFWALGMRDDKLLDAQWIGRVPESVFVGAAVVFWNGGQVPDPAGSPSGPSTSQHFRVGGTPVKGRVRSIESHNDEGDVSRVLIDVQRPVSPGSIGSWDLPGPELRGRRLLAPAIDDLGGVAALMCVLHELVKHKASSPLTCLFTRAEEAGFIGCIQYCKDVRQAASDNGSALPHVIGLEMSMALPHARIGDGPIIRVGDRRSVFDNQITAECTTAAAALEASGEAFHYQRALMNGGTCESSVFQALLDRSGAVCLALGNYHNIEPTHTRIEREYIDTGDFVNFVRLLIEITHRHARSRPAIKGFQAWCDGWANRHAHLLTDATGTTQGDV